MGERQKRKLGPQGVDLCAVLDAYDVAQKEMSPEEKAAQNKRIVTGEEHFIVSGEEAEARRVIVVIKNLEETIEKSDQTKKA